MLQIGLLWVGLAQVGSAQSNSYYRPISVQLRLQLPFGTKLGKKSASSLINIWAGYFGSPIKIKSLCVNSKHYLK